MKAHNKILLLALGIVFILFLFVLQYQYIRKQEIKVYIKSEHARDDQVIDNVLKFKSAGFLKPTKDNSAWDEMFEYTKTKDSAWALENLDGVKVTFDMSIIGAFDTNGNALYCINDSSSKEYTITPENINKWFSKDSVITCFIENNGDIYEIFGAEIVPSFDIFYNTNPSGYLITAKKWDKNYIAEVKTSTGFDISIVKSINDDSIGNEAEKEIITKQVKDIDGKTIAFLKFVRSRDYAKELVNLNYLAYYNLAILIASIIIFFYLLNLWINKPLKTITKSLTEESLQPIEKLLDKKNEFGKIAGLIKEFNAQKSSLVNEVMERTKANEKYKALLLAQPDMIFILDRKGLFLDYYAPHDNKLYKQPSEFLGRYLHEVFPFEFVNEIYKNIEQIYTKTDIYTIEYKLEMPDVSSYNEARIVAIDNERLLVVVRDISENKIAEKELILAKERAQESDRLKSAFLSNMSHEIRTPMHAILGFSSLLDEKSVSEEEKTEYIAIIKRSGKELMTIINDIIDISKIDSNLLKIKKSTSNLNSLLDNLLLAFENEKARLDKKEIDLILEKLLPDNTFILCDNVRLTQILNNLIGNALKFTEKGHIKFGYRIKDKEMLFYVEDTGKGIAKQNQDIIFERFRQEEESTSRSYGGAGLGLPISKGLIEIMGGKIWVESEEGKGSKFYFTLPDPIINNSEFDNSETLDLSKDYDFKGKTILIAEDVPENFELIKIMLRHHNINLILAVNGSVAVEIFEANKDISLVLMDIRMPIMNGFEATRIIKSINPSMPVVALTAHAFSEEKALCYEAGCNDFISKPLDKGILLLTLDKFLST
jgi:signal transduction histidine kinase/CheY-like chemotaxis protein